MWSDDLPREIAGMHMSENPEWVSDLQLVPWVQFLAVVDPNGKDFTRWVGHGVICRLRTGGWGSNKGTIPSPDEHEEGAVRTAAFVAASKGCHIWGIGNEPNLPWERYDEDVIITPDEYADYYVKAEKYIHAIPGRQDDWVMPAAIGPWNTETTYEGNEIGDWVLYYGDMVRLILEKGGRIDAVQLHTYTHGSSPGLIPSLQKMNPPFEERFYNFLAFLDFMAATPVSLYSKPFIISEMNQNGAWENTGWLREAFKELDLWNHEEDGLATIWAAFTFRYEDELYGMKQHPDVMDEFHSVVDIGYTRPEEEPMPERILYQSSFENGFHPQDGETHVMVPTGWMAAWDENFGKRPEFKPKDKEQGHPEVRTGRFAAGFFHVSTRFAGVLFKQFTVAPNAQVRATVWCMGVHSSGQAAGMSIGIFNTTDFFSSDQEWEEWWSPNMGEYQDRVWKKIEAFGIADTSGKFYVALLGRADEAIPDWNTHWDDPTVYVTDDGGPVDPPVDPPTGGIMGHVAAARAELDAIEAIVANPFLCIRA